MYIPPLCPIIGPYFYNPSVFLQFLYVIINHARFAKSITQIAMVLNRMTCVMMPAGYDHMWKKLTPMVWVSLLVIPFGGTWNCIISRVYIGPFRGGFTMNYIRTVEWAAVSFFQSIYILTALLFTVICTTVTVYKLFMLSRRIKSVEKSLFLSSILISIIFLLVGATQLAFAFCSVCQGSLLYVLQLLAFDTFTVGSAVIMIITDKRLRYSVLPCLWGPKKI
ncbi:hypothetical protein GCK72_006732 [Caenorhabditis remanei]|uniref:Serpentine receptor class gamma n=1 Tax=Caenorhabditis remanei TaxID=31234 RepID=A0A6A5HJK1_CAERE|nr:hypothetical protein GCK72_006732 [Caenorhabditis remanei]KAF1766774.1 hypothetical protein GCK72_006732 [Caenorhabditis remanei]